MSFCNIQIPSNATVLPVDTRTTAWKVVFLPTASTNQGRVLTIKDQYGTARISSFTISTTGLDLIDNTNYFFRFQSSLTSLTLLSDGQRSWQTLSYVNDVNAYQSPFSPSSFSTLAIWVDASDPWNRGSLSTVTQTVLPTWFDKSGGQRNLLVSSTDGTTRIQSTVYTALISGVSNYTVSMNTNLYVLNNPTLISSGATGNTMISILRATGTDQQCLFAGNATFQKTFYRNGFANFEIAYGARNVVSQNNASNFTVASFIWSPSTSLSYIRLNGSNFTTGNAVFNLSSVQNVSDRFFLGGQPGMGGQSFRAFTGNFAEILYYNSNLPSSQIAVLEGYLGWKWGIQTTLAPSHPYRYTIPSSYDVSTPV